MITENDIENWFSYHAPTDSQQEAYVEIRVAAKTFARVLNEYLPESADKTATFKKLREIVMSANQTIACNTTI